MSEAFNSQLSYLVIEDRAEDRRQLNDILADEGFDPDRGHTAEYRDEAKEKLAELASALDVVFLDLNIPIKPSDTRPERDNGRSLLTFIRDDLNHRPGVDISVIVVSGEDVHDDFHRSTLMDAYKGTLAGVCPKTELSRVLKAVLKRLRRDPLRSSLRNANPALEEAYAAVVEGTGPIKDRLECAKNIVRWLLACDLELTTGRVGAATTYGDNISKLVNAVLAARFTPDGEYDPRPNMRLLKPGLLWKDNPWRGAMIQHIRSINLYRNTYIHIADQSFDAPHAWVPDAAHLQECQEGKAVGTIVAGMITDLLRWMLPWHQNVYAPWRGSQPR